MPLDNLNMHTNIEFCFPYNLSYGIKLVITDNK